MPIWRGVTGLAKGLERGELARQEAEAKRKGMAYESLLRREEKAIPTPMNPQQIENIQSQIRERKQKVLQGKIDSILKLSDKRGNPLPGLSHIRQTKISEMETQLAPLYQSGGPLSGKGGLLEQYFTSDRNSPDAKAILQTILAEGRAEAEKNESIPSIPDPPKNVPKGYEAVLDPLKIDGEIVDYQYKLKKIEEKKPTKWDLQKRAQDEARTMLGGSSMVGLVEGSREEYEKLSKEIYQRYLTQYGYTEAKPTPAPTPTPKPTPAVEPSPGLSRDITATDPKTGKRVIWINGKWQPLTR